MTNKVPGTPNYFDLLMERRDEQRREKAEATLVIKGNDLPTESNRHGFMQWYLHPAIPGLAVRSELVYVQTIPPGSRSGKQHHPGGLLFYFWRGKGHTILDDVEYPWRTSELLTIPHRVDGSVYQHFNDSPDEPAKILAFELNMTESLGVDRGSGWEQLEDSPDFTGPES